MAVETVAASGGGLAQWLMLGSLAGSGLMLAMGLQQAHAQPDELSEEAKHHSVKERMAQLAKGDFGSDSDNDELTQKPKGLREKELEKSFSERVLFPLAQQVFEVTQGIIPLSSKSWVRLKLLQAGFTKLHYPKIFLGIQLLCSAVLFAMLLGLSSITGKVSPGVGLIIAAFFGAAGYCLPMLWLFQQAQKRQESIQKSLPDFIDLLVICMEAGLGLDVAIQKICQLKSIKTSEHLREELRRYGRDIGFGKPRKQALLALSERIGVDDFAALVNALIQAFEMGSGIATTLRVQADSLRVKRLQKAEEKANKIPVKMIIPIYVFLFPAIFVSMFGPMAVLMIKSVMAIMNQVGDLNG